MDKVFKKFDMKAPPIRQRQWLRPVTWALSFPFTLSQKTKIIKKNCEGLKPPYILLCNHNGFFDFMLPAGQQCLTADRVYEKTGNGQ